MIRFLRSLSSRSEGAAAVEFALVCIPMLLITIGIMEFGFALFQWNSAEKATQFGVRVAVVRPAIASSLHQWDGKLVSNEFGDSPMPDFAAAPVECDGATGTCSQVGDNFDPNTHPTFTRIVSKMQEIFPAVRPANVVVEYVPIQLGFVGRCGPVPSVTVRLQNMVFDFMVIDTLANLTTGSSIAMPSFNATMVGEDLNEGENAVTCP